VLLAELLNSALEQVADELFPGYHPRAKVIKDLGSAAVGLALLVLALTWIALLLTARTALLA
jgi:diacylglycerol kinase (ATP)